MKNFQQKNFFTKKILTMAEIPSLNKLVEDFTLPDQNGIRRSLSDFIGEWVLLFFYLKDDTPI